MDETEEERQCVRRLRAIGAELDALAAYEAGLTAERRVLVSVLTSRYGWPQHEVARALGISQPRVHQLLHGQKRRRRDAR